MPTPITRTLLVLALGAGVLAGCGSDDDGDTAADDGTPNAAAVAGSSGGDELSWPSEDAYGTGEAGTVTVDGTEYGIDEVRLCDATDFFLGDDREADWRMQGVGAADPEEDYHRNTELVEVQIYTGTGSRDRALQAVGWDGPEGIYDGELLGVDAVLEVGDRVTGPIELRSALGNPPVEATVDVAVPEGDVEPCDD